MTGLGSNWASMDPPPSAIIADDWFLNPAGLLLSWIYPFEHHKDVGRQVASGANSVVACNVVAF